MNYRDLGMILIKKLKLEKTAVAEGFSIPASGELIEAYKRIGDAPCTKREDGELVQHTPTFLAVVSRVNDSYFVGLSFPCYHPTLKIFYVRQINGYADVVVPSRDKELEAMDGADMYMKYEEEFRQKVGKENIDITQI